MSVLAEAGTWRTAKRRWLPQHRNPGLEVIAVTGGHAEWVVEGVTHRVPPGSVFFTWPWERHGGVRDPQPGLDLVYVVIRMRRAYRRPPPRREQAWYRDLPLTALDGRRVIRVLREAEGRVFPLTASIVSLTHRLVAEHNGGGPLREAMIRALSAATLVELSRLVTVPRSRQAHVLGAELRVERFVEQLASRCDEPWSVEAMAAACGLGRSRLTDLVRRQTGDPPLILLNRLRVERAKLRLTQSDTKVIDIALACGFSSPQYFCRVFRDYTGQTPLAYRRAVSEGDPGSASHGVAAGQAPAPFNE